MSAPLLSQKDAAAKLGLSPHTLRAWRGKGWGPAYVKLGTGRSSPVGYTEAALEAFIAQQTRRSTSDVVAGLLAAKQAR